MQDGKLVIKDDDREKVTLESPELVNGMIETDGTENLLTYEWEGKTSEAPRVRMISVME